MNKKSYKTILLPIEVCTGNFCWGDGKICGYLNYEGGYPTCDLRMSYDLKSDKKNRVLKPKKCKNLKEMLNETKETQMDETQGSRTASQE